MKDLWKILLGIGVIGGGWMLFSSFRNKPAALPQPDINTEPDNNIIGDPEEYAVDLWMFNILKAGPGWGQQIKEAADKKGVSFESELRNVAISKYVEKNALPDEPIPTYFENSIRRIEIAMKLSASWMKAIETKAAENNLTIEQQMRKSAIWHVLHNLMKPFLTSEKSGNKPSYGRPDKGLNGGKVLMSI